MPYYIVHAEKSPRQFLKGLTIDPKLSQDKWIPRWTEDKSIAYRFWSLNDVRRYARDLLDPAMGPYKIFETKPKAQT